MFTTKLVNLPKKYAMLNINLIDSDAVHTALLPITFTRPVSEVQCGMLTLRQWWQTLLPANYGYGTNPLLAELFPPVEGDEVVELSSNIIPSRELAEAVACLRTGQQLVKDGEVIASRGCGKHIEFYGDVERLTGLCEIFMRCGEWMQRQFPLLTQGIESADVPAGTTLIGERKNLFIHPHAKVCGAIINVTDGPVYIGAGAEVMEGACLRGPVAVMDGSHVNMGAKVYGPTVVAHECRVGGELNNVVMHPYSNKAHDGFIGNAVIGSWCNLGAGCSASNLKNDYTEARLWDYSSQRFKPTGLLFCGLIMGDHSKAGINTMFNTASSVGVGVNVHGSGFPRTYLPNFHDGSSTTGFAPVIMKKFLATARKVMERRGVELTPAHERLFTALAE